MKSLKILLTTLLLTTLALPTQADEIEDQINRGIKAYQAGEHNKAVEELKFAIAQIQDVQKKQQQTLLPDPPDGWETADVEASTMPMSVLGGGTHLARIYSRGEEQVQLEMIANSPMLTAMTMVLTNPAMLASTPNAHPYRYKEARGILKKQGDGAEISLMVAKNIMLKVSSANVQDEEVLKTFLDATDIEKIKQTLTP